MIPRTISSQSMGLLVLTSSPVRVGGETVIHYTYESEIQLSNRRVSIVISPDLDTAIQGAATRRIIQTIRIAETIFDKIRDLGELQLFSIQKEGVIELGEQYDYERWNASPDVLLNGWKLSQIVFFDDAIRTFWKEHPIYYLDLVLEYTLELKPSEATFSG